MLPDVAGGSFPTRFVTGARFALGSVGYTFAHPTLLRAALVPMALQLALCVALAVAGAEALHHVAARYDASLDALPGFVRVLLWIILGFVALVLSAIVTFFAGSVVCDPFYDWISERTEALVTGREVAGARGPLAIAAGIARELWATVVRLSVYLAGMGVLTLLSLIPGVALVGGPLSMGWSWLFLAIEVFARPQARGALGGRERLRVVRAHLFLSLGFGAGGWLVALVPFTTPMLVVGGTRLYLALVAHHRLPPLGDAAEPGAAIRR